MAVGKGTRFNTAVEVQGGFKGTVYGHSRFKNSYEWLFTYVKAYKNTTIRFAEADPGFPRAIRTRAKAYGSTPVSSDGGRTWRIDNIVVPDSKY
jgi:hypothetical protein